MGKLTVLKIGGSVITEKEKTDYTVRTNLLRDIFATMEDVRGKHPDEKLIVIHGGGGHVHHIAKQYGLKTSCKGNVEKTQNALRTQSVTKRLNNDVVAIAHEVALPLFPIQTSAVIQNTDGTIRSFDMRALESALSQNLIPVLYGDMVLDDVRGLSICSGDTISAYLTIKLSIERVLFASDIDGIYTNDPHLYEGSELIETISLSDIDNGAIGLSDSHNTDMTDGLRGKLNECRGLFDKAPRLAQIEIFNGLVPKNFEKALLEEPFPHSCIKK